MAEAAPGTTKPPPTDLPTARRSKNPWWFRLILWVIGVGGLAYVVWTTKDQFPEMLHAVQNANPWWVLACAAFAVTGALGAAVSMFSCLPGKFPSLAQGYELQLANQFVGTVTPANVGALALTVRFLSLKVGSTATATATVAAQAVIQLTTHALLVVLLGVFMGQNLGAQISASAGPVALIVGITIVVIVAVVALVPALRKRVVDFWSEHALPALRQVQQLLRQPVRLGGAVLGAAVGILSGAAGLWAAIQALGGGSQPLAAAFTTMVGGALGAAAPTPGGVGAVEAAMTLSLTNLGVGAAVVVPAVMLHRTISNWIPTLLGAVALQTLERRHLI